MTVPGVGPFRKQGRTAAAAAGLLVVALAAGCTTARSDLGPSDSSCYRALPAATKAIGGHGQLLSVQRFSAATLRRQAPHLLDAVLTGEASSQDVCMIAFKGQFTAATVSHPYGLSSGRLAVVATTTPADHLLGTFVFSRPPFGLGRLNSG
jgi:hypothetical protein